MLLVGTDHGLFDLDSQRVLVDAATVTALADCCAVLNGNELVRVGAAGVESVAKVVDAQSVVRLAPDRFLVGQAGAHLTVVDGGVAQSLVSFDAVPGRDEWENPAAATPDTRTLAVDDAGRLFVNVHVGGLWCSDDGATWWCAVEPDADVHEVRCGASGVVAVAAAVGFGWSTDSGSTWSWTTDGLHAHYMRCVALDGRRCIASASTGPFTRQGALYRGEVGGRLERCRDGLPEWFAGNVDSGCVALAAGRAVAGTRDGSVYESADFGASWTTVADGLPPVRAVELVLA